MCARGKLTDAMGSLKYHLRLRYVQLNAWESLLIIQLLTNILPTTVLLFSLNADGVHCFDRYTMQEHSVLVKHLKCYFDAVIIIMYCINQLRLVVIVIFF